MSRKKIAYIAKKAWLARGDVRAVSCDQQYIVNREEPR
jgi:hypothetical protein